MIEPTDDRSSIARAWAWSSRITAVSLEMSLPAVVGHWIDEKLGTVMVFLVAGVIFGMTSGLIHLVRMTRPTKPEDRASNQRQNKA